MKVKVTGSTHIKHSEYLGEKVQDATSTFDGVAYEVTTYKSDKVTDTTQYKKRWFFWKQINHDYKPESVSLTGSELKALVNMTIELVKENDKIYLIYKTSGLLSSEVKGEVQIDGDTTWEEFLGGGKRTRFVLTQQGAADINRSLEESVRKQYASYAKLDINFEKMGSSMIEADNQTIEVNVHDQKFTIKAIK